MSKFRKKPVVIEAFQMTLERRFNNVDWLQWMHEAWNYDRGDTGSLSCAENSQELKDEDNYLFINTPEGVMKVSWNDYIIQGVQGEIYPCKPDIFEATYEEV